jgi:hypothetical protein
MAALATTVAQEQHHHALFRRQACSYLSTCNDPILKEMETCLGRYALENDTALIVTKKHCADEVTTVDMRVPPQFIHCHGCGSYVNHTTRIQSIARARTRRRRASRKLAAMKKEQNRQTQHQPQNHRNNKIIAARTNSNLSPPPVDEKELKRLFSVMDGTCKNSVVQTCEHCGVHRKMQGIPANKQQLRKAAQAEKRKELVSQKKGTKSNDGDYVALPAKKKIRHQEPPAYQSTLAFAGTKKKKKKKPPPKSGLMNFLSSLNH